MVLLVLLILETKRSIIKKKAKNKKMQKNPDKLKQYIKICMYVNFTNYVIKKLCAYNKNDNNNNKTAC